MVPWARHGADVDSIAISLSRPLSVPFLLRTSGWFSQSSWLDSPYPRIFGTGQLESLPDWGVRLSLVRRWPGTQVVITTFPREELNPHHLRSKYCTLYLSKMPNVFVFVQITNFICQHCNLHSSGDNYFPARGTQPSLPPLQPQPIAKCICPIHKMYL